MGVRSNRYSTVVTFTENKINCAGGYTQLNTPNSLVGFHKENMAQAVSCNFSFATSLLHHVYGLNVDWIFLYAKLG